MHELGHLLFSPFGQWLMVAGGSLTQVAAPAVAAIVLARQGDLFGIAVTGTWEAYSLANLAAYIGDARAQAMPLVSVSDSDEIIHDWNYLLDHAHLLTWDTRLAGVTRFVGALVLLASLALGAWQCVRLATADAGSLRGPQSDV